MPAPRMASPDAMNYRRAMGAPQQRAVALSCLIAVACARAAYAEPGTATDEPALATRFPTLRDWVHPLPGVKQKVQDVPGRLFGAPRSGGTRARLTCGEGHCGVDLHADRGHAVVAVANGVVVRIQGRRKSKDKISGRFVRIRHEDGTFSTYMHLDRIARGLDKGDRIAAGQQLGTVGFTGVKSRTPHLHFALEIPNEEGDEHDPSRARTVFVDPAPFLMRSHVTKRPGRKRSVKPAS